MTKQEASDAVADPWRHLGGKQDPTVMFADVPYVAPPDQSDPAEAMLVLAQFGALMLRRAGWPGERWDHDAGGLGYIDLSESEVKQDAHNAGVLRTGERTPWEGCAAMAHRLLREIGEEES